MEPGVGSAPARNLSSRLDRLEERIACLNDGISARLDRALQALELIVDDDPRARRRLHELRADTTYEEAYTEREPLVSVIIPTWNRTESLTTHAIPSVLAQSYPNVEVVVVGDCSPPELANTVTAISDRRVRFHNRSIRGPYPADPLRAWCVSGTPPLTEGLRHARGRWMTVIGDDDAIPADHIARLLAFARSRRLEFACGRFRVINYGGATEMLGSFPPQLGASGLQISLWHAGLRFLEFELAHSLFLIPNDWGLIRRMMRIGVVMGQTDDVVVDYKPSGRGLEFGAPPPDERVTLRREVSDLRDQIDELEAARVRAETSLADTVEDAHAERSELERRLREVQRSKSWRLTAPVRRLTKLRRRTGEPGL